MKLKIVLLVLPFLLYGIGFFLHNYYDWFGYCMGEISVLSNGKETCWRDYGNFAWPLRNFGLYLLPVSILLFFSSRRVLSVWWKRFAIWFVPLGIILFLIVDTYPHEFTYILPGSSWVATQLSSIFFIISAFIVFFGNRKKSS